MQGPTAVTADQLLALHEPGWRHELVRGELRRMSPAGHWHGFVVARITRRLDAHVEEHGLGGVLGAETGFLLTRAPDTVLAPDVAFLRATRMPRRGAGFFPGAPDLAVEVISPGESRRAVRAKARCWLAHGAGLVWVVDPASTTVTVYDAHGPARRFTADDELSGGDVVPGFRVRVGELFPPA